MAETANPQVQKQIDQVSLLEQQMMAQRYPELQEETGQQQDGPAEQQGSMATNETQAQPRQAQQAPDDDDATWEQRYKSFKGTADKQLKEMNAALKEARNELGDLKEQNRKLQEQMTEQQQTQAQAQQAQQQASLVTDDDVESFGSDMIDMAQRAARKVFMEMSQNLENKLVDRINKLESHVGGVGQQVQQTTEQQFFERLGELVPNWQELNEDQDFLDWLAQTESMSGRTRQELLNDAASNFDVNRTAQFFKVYQDQSGSGQASKDSSLNKQVSPKRSSKSSSQSNTKGKRVWTQQEISQAYQDIARGALKADQAAKLNAELDAAVSEGRVR